MQSDYTKLKQIPQKKFKIMPKLIKNQPNAFRIYQINTKSAKINSKSAKLIQNDHHYIKSFKLSQNKS